MSKIRSGIDVSERLSVLEERVGNWITTTDEYRRRKDVCSQVLFDKIDTLQTTLSKLPCGKREGMYSSIKGQLAAIWVFVCGGVALAIKHFVESK